LIVEHAAALYITSPIAGITGTRSANSADVAAAVTEAAAVHTFAIAVGFGIRTRNKPPPWPAPPTPPLSAPPSSNASPQT